MAFEIRKYDSQPIPKAKPRKQAGYLAFIRTLPCAISGAMTGIEAAHLSFKSPWHGHYGRGRGTKAPDRWALPLSSEAHRRQHNMREEAFWAQAGIDPHDLALALYGLWCDLGDDAQPFAAAIINQRLAASGRLRVRELS